MNPKLSIIVPCYNQAEYLNETLQSVSDQNLADWECIIVNDGSTDNSEAVALKWANSDSRFKYFSKHNTGVSDTRNFAIAQATGLYILPLDGDDLISKEYTSQAIDILEKDAIVKLVYSNVSLFGTVCRPVEDKPYDFNNLLTENLIPCSAIYRKTDFDRTKGYNINMVKGLEDWDFWLTFLQANDQVVKLIDYHFFYRIKIVSRSTQIDRDKNEALILQIFKNHTDLYLEFLNPIRNKIEADYYKHEQTRLMQTAEYRVGRIILFPFRIIGRIWNKIFK